MFKFRLMTLGLAAIALSSRADTHIYGGATGTNQNDKCVFSNGALFDATVYAFPQVLRTNGLNAGHYRGDALTFSSLAATEINGGPIPAAAAFGAELAIQVVSVDGPPGGSFEFWEGDGESDLGTITLSAPVGTTDGTNWWVISENNGVAGTDPYGHIHGREITTSKPGTYIVGIRVIDVSTNGVNGGPIQSPSDVLLLKLQAGLRIESVQNITNRITVSFRAPPGISNVLEATDSLLSSHWQPVSAPLRGLNNGFNNLQSFTDTNAVVGNRFYRIHQLNTLP
jgi:hypothetical protein